MMKEQKNKFERLGAKNVQIGGNLKTQMPPPKINRELINKIKKAASGKKIILLASSHSGEEKNFIREYRNFRIERV